MRPATRHAPPLLALALPLAACGGTAELPRVYSAEQLNSVATPALPDDSFGGVGAAPEPYTPPSPGEGPAASPPSPAALRVIHASPDAAARSVSVFVDDSQVAAVQALAYKSIAGALELAPGEHRVTVRGAAAAPSASPVFQGSTPALEAGRRYTAVVHGLAAGTPRVALAAAADDAPQPDAGKARVRFFHAIVGLGAVDVCTQATPAQPARPAAGNQPAQAARPAQPAQALFANVAYGAFGAYTEVPSGAPVVLQVRAQNARPCTGAVRGTVRVTPADQGVVTAVAVGRAAGAPAVARELLLCADAPSSGAPSCAASPIR